MSGTPSFNKEVAHNQIYKVSGRMLYSESSGKALGTLPKNAIPLRASVMKKTGFNGGGATVLLGIEGDTDAFMASADIDPANTGFKEKAIATFDAGLANWPLSAKKDVIVTVTGNNTAGEFHFCVEYYFPHDVANTADFD